MKYLILAGLISILSISSIFYYSQNSQYQEFLNNTNGNNWDGFAFTTNFTSQDFCLSTVNSTPDLSHVPVSNYTARFQGFGYGGSDIKFKTGNNVFCSQSNGNYKVDLLQTNYYSNNTLFSDIVPINQLNTTLYGQTNGQQLTVQKGIEGLQDEQVYNQESLLLFNSFNTTTIGKVVENLLYQNIEPIQNCQNLEGSWKGQIFTREFTDQSNCLSQIDAEFYYFGNDEIQIKGNTFDYSYSATQYFYQTCPTYVYPIDGLCKGLENKLILDDGQSIGFATEKIIFIQQKSANILLYRDY